MKALAIIELEKLNKFPILDEDALYESSYYQKKSISVFDHWLSEEEAEVALNEENKNEYEPKFLDFYKYLFLNYLVYAYYDLHNLYSGKIVKFDGIHEYINCVQESLNEWFHAVGSQKFLRILVPELGIILNGGYDYTHTLFLAEGADLAIIEKIVNDHGLFILD